MEWKLPPVMSLVKGATQAVLNPVGTLGKLAYGATKELTKERAPAPVLQAPVGAGMDMKGAMRAQQAVGKQIEIAKTEPALTPWSQATDSPMTFQLDTKGALLPQAMRQRGVGYTGIKQPEAQRAEGEFMMGVAMGANEAPKLVQGAIGPTTHMIQGATTKIGKELLEHPLFQEARKFKSADEFVGAQFSKKSEYAMSHRPSFEGMPPAHNLLEGEQLPRDVYEHPDYSIATGRIKSGDKPASGKRPWELPMTMSLGK